MFFIVWGRRAYSRSLGYVAEFCPACKTVRSFRVTQRALKSHVLFVPLNSGKPLGCTGRCVQCGNQYRVEPKNYTGFWPRAEADTAALIAATNPRLNAAKAAAPMRAAAPAAAPARLSDPAGPTPPASPAQPATAFKPKIDPEDLKQSCRTLAALLHRYSATEPDAGLCLRELMPFFRQVTSGQIVEPQKQAAPCAYHFVEGSLRRHRDLGEAYSRFSMALQGISEAMAKQMVEEAVRRSQARSKLAAGPQAEAKPMIAVDGALPLLKTPRPG
jgi:hypothetical protein